ncbi:hypothetical protein DFJ63DRAFT_255792 [Scheffersomyces coipomensis]|uniref:uncharacterized protein n=1 Tax=Scheffersomyces coipomensis TaxID=1788519 RepID=UPI00315C9192
MEVVQSYISEINEISRIPNNQKNQIIARLAAVLNLNPSQNPYIAQINSVPFQIEDKTLDKLIETANLFNGEWLAFNELIASFVKLCNQMNPWSSLESFDLYTTFINDLSISFNNNARGFFLIEVVKNSIQVILPLANHLDYQLYFKEHCEMPRLTYLASILLKIFNNIRSQINDANNPKRNIILFISNKLCSVYFKINSPLLCRNVFSNMNNANVSFKSFNKLEQLQYRYYLSKFCLIKQELTSAFENFNWCLENLPITAINNINKVLKYHLPLSLVIGKRINFNYINQVYSHARIQPPEFITIYYQLNQFIKLGDLKSFNQIILNSYQYFKSENLLLLLLTKSKVIILRNLIKKIWINTGKPSFLDYDCILAGLKLSLDTNPLTLPLITSLSDLTESDLIIENIFITLIDQNLIRGKIFPRLRKISVSKINVFVNVDEMNLTRFPPNVDNWMN